MADDNPTAASDRAPEVRPKRPIYRSYGELIRTLIADATKRVRSTPQPEPKLETITPRMRALARHYVKHRKLMQDAERELRNQHDAQVSDSGALSLAWHKKNELQAKPGKLRQAKLDRIAQLKIRATLDTIDMTPKQAKAYLLRLEQQLRKV